MMKIVKVKRLNPIIYNVYVYFMYLIKKRTERVSIKPGLEKIIVYENV